MRVIKNYNKLEETITIKDLDKWKRESSMWSKNIRRVNNWKDYRDMVIGSRAWGLEFESWLFEEILGTSRGGNDENKLDARVPSVNFIRENVWTFVSYVNHEFLEMFHSNIKDRFNRYYFHQKYDLSTYASYTQYPVAAWEELYQKFETVKNPTYAKYTRLAREAFKALDLLFKELDDMGIREVNSSKLETRLKVMGVDVKILDSEANPRYKNFQIVSQITRALKELDAWGLSRLMRGITLTVDLFAEMTKDGSWESYTKEIVIDLGAFFDRTGNRVVYTFFHEFGHMYFDRYMSKEQQEIWKNFRKSTDNYFKFTKSDVDSWTKLLRSMGYFEMGKFNIDKKEDMINMLPSNVKDPIFKVKTLALVAGEFIDVYAEDTSLDYLVGLQVWSGVVTAYSIEKYGESFPEVLANFLTKVPIPAPAEQVLRWVVPELR